MTCEGWESWVNTFYKNSTEYRQAIAFQKCLKFVETSYRDGKRWQENYFPAK